VRTVGRPSLWAVLGVGVVVAAVVPILDDAFLDGPSLAAPLAVILPLAAIALVGRRPKST
jgi:VIT1/CCC1 family predicted Fe2+/Mn2+ transporter